LTAAIGDDVCRLVHVQGTINLGSSSVRFGSNKTIVGLGSESGFIGNLKGVDENNVILQNLNFTNPNSVGDGDGLTLDGCTHIWVDHCSFVQCGDGSLDITHGSDFITVSWCKFSYTSNTGHNFVNLIGHSDTNSSEDTGGLKVTFHHNWWSTLCVERMPRVRFGRVHTYNNYFNCSGNNHCIRASIQSHVLAENNYFETINTPFQKYASSPETGSQVGLICSAGNTFVNCSGVQNFNDAVFTPPYSYSLESPATARSAIISSAGPTLNFGNTISNGTYRTVARHSSKALDAAGSGNGTQIHQWTYLGGNNQQWAFHAP
jgi:pectate lyase